MSIDLNNILALYKTNFEEETEDLELLSEQILSNYEIFSRKNFVGHITASGLILDISKQKILLIKHKILDKFLQPGGHVDENETPLQAAIREISEETGLENLEYIPLNSQNPNLPLDIDTHYIPNNPKKDEQAHYHHDFRYCFVANNLDNLQIAENEISELKWLDLEEALHLENLNKMIGKVKFLLKNNIPTRFFDEIIKDFPKKEFASIIVTHLLPDRPFLLECLNNLTDLISIIPKPKSIDQNVVLKVENTYNLDYFDRNQVMKNLENILERTDKKVVILDIGGYFSTLSSVFAKYSDKIIGVVEDTENGHQKYENLTNLAFPVISVARSPLKENEDFLVGQSIVFSTDAILRSYNRLISFAKCGVIGYGKIGKSITNCLQNMQISPFLFDSDPIKMISAINNSNQAVNKEKLLQNSEVIFCASGNQSLNINDFRRIQNGAFIISVTSSEDEFDMSFLKSEYKSKQVAQYITRYTSKYNTFYLLNNGNAVNFIHSASVGDFIFLVQSEIIESAKYLMENPNLKPAIYQLEEEKRQKIAKIWLKHFNS